MPAVSEKQRRAMYAAAEGKSKIGIPRSVGKEFVGSDEKLAGASVCFVAPDGRILFLHRADGKGWDIPGGGREGDETAEDNALREVQEKTGGMPYGELSPLDRQDTDAVNWTVFHMPVRHAFTPMLSDEHDDFRWSFFEDRPDDMMPETEGSLARGFEPQERQTDKPEPVRASDCLAFDRASVRNFDQDGRLHVEATHISKANVCPYRGDEIPDAEDLGLEPDKVYMLLRDPEELERAAPTANNIPVLDAHIAVSAEDHQPDSVIGATGSDAAFNAPYLDNSMVIWVKDAIDRIEDKTQHEISCSYYYRADMTPGVHDGIHYDGVMRDIKFNHVAIVEKGRAGPDVVVGDSLSQLIGETTMGKSLSKKAAMAKGALLAILKPKKLAADKALDLDKILADVTTKNWLSKKPGILAAIKGKLARDADMSDVVDLIDALDGEKPEDESEIVEDADPRIEKILQLIRGKVSDEDLAAVASALADDEDDEDDQEDERAEDEPEQTEGAATARPDENDGKEEMVSKSAMDAALATERARSAKQLKEAEQRTIERLHSITEAEEVARPYVGKLAAMDSAEAVYKAALDILGVDVAGVHPSAYKAVLTAQTKPGEARKMTIAADSAMPSDISDVFPNLARLR